MSYVLPNDPLSAILVQAIIDNKNVDMMEHLFNNFLRGSNDESPAVALLQDLTQEVSIQEFWKQFNNQKIKLYDNINSLNYVLISPLQLAARNGNLELVKYLIRKHPEADRPMLLRDIIRIKTWDDKNHIEIEGLDYPAGTNVLFFAITYGHIELANYLLEIAPGLADFVDIDHNTPLHYTTKLGYRSQVTLPTHYYFNAQGQDPDVYARQHYFQDALNTLRDTRKNKIVQDNLDYQTHLNNLEAYVHKLHVIVKEMNPDDHKHTTDFAFLTNGIINTIVNAKFNDGKIAAGVTDPIAEYKNKIAKDMIKYADYNATSKKLWTAFAFVVGAIIAILIALTGIGLAAEVAGIGFIAGISAASSSSAVFGAAAVVGGKTVVGVGMSSIAWLGGAVVGGGIGYTYQHRKYINRGPKLINNIENELKEIEKLDVNTGNKVIKI